MSDEIEGLQRSARVLVEAAEILEGFAAEKDDMVDEGKLPDDDTSDEIQESFEDAASACNHLAMSIVIVAAQEGVIIDLDEEASLDTDDDAGTSRRGFQ